MGQLAVGIDGEFDGAAFEFVELIDERGGIGIVAVGFGSGAGFLVGGAQADGAGGAVRARIDGENVDAELHQESLFQLRCAFGVDDGRRRVAGRGGAGGDLIAQNLAYREFRTQMQALRRCAAQRECERAKNCARHEGAGERRE